MPILDGYGRPWRDPATGESLEELAAVRERLERGPQERLLDSWKGDTRRVFLGADYGHGPSYAATYHWRPGPVVDSERIVFRTGGRGGGKSAAADEATGTLRLEELEPGVWGRR